MSTTPKAIKAPETPKDGLSIHMAAAAIMQAIKPIEKNSENTGQKFWFRGIEEVLAALHPILAAHGVILVPNVLSLNHAEIGKNKSGNPIYCATAHVGFSLSGPKGDAIMGSSAGVAFDSGDKAMPKAQTMALKTWLTHTFTIPTYDMPDADNYDPSVEPMAQVKAAPDLTLLSDTELAYQIEVVKKNTEAASAQGLDLATFIATRNTLEDEQNRREAEKPAAPAPEPVPQSAAKRVPRARRLPATAPEAEKAPDTAPAQPVAVGWRAVTLECSPMRKHRDPKVLTLGEITPDEISGLKKGWVDAHAAKIALDAGKAALAKAICEAYRKLFPKENEVQSAAE